MPSAIHSGGPSQTSSTAILPGDGFTSSEIESIFQSTQSGSQWLPEQEYADFDIGRLQPGPRYVTFVGRVANMYHTIKPSKRQNAAQGWLKLMLGDDTGAITVQFRSFPVSVHDRSHKNRSASIMHLARTPLFSGSLLQSILCIYLREKNLPYLHQRRLFSPQYSLKENRNATSLSMPTATPVPYARSPSILSVPKLYLASLLSIPSLQAATTFQTTKSSSA